VLPAFALEWPNRSPSTAWTGLVEEASQYPSCSERLPVRESATVSVPGFGEAQGPVAVRDDFFL
jgi:hypothetical protein